MTAPDLSGLGGWADLPFWTRDYPRIAAALATDDRAIYPAPDRMFAALTRTQPDACRVVILGQDPYHTPGKADGLAFSIPQGFGGRLDSLGNIFKELHADLDVIRTHTDLTDWADQGVLLLNPILSVAEGLPLSHKDFGWHVLTRQVIARLAGRPRAYLLWGKPAQTFAPDRTSDLVIRSAHPSPLSARRGFFGSRPFSTVNDWLRQQGQVPIDWAGRK